MKDSITIVTLMAVQFDGDVNVDTREVRDGETVEGVEAELRDDMVHQLEGFAVAAITKTVTVVHLPAPVEIEGEHELAAGSAEVSLQDDNR